MNSEEEIVIIINNPRPKKGALSEQEIKIPFIEGESQADTLRRVNNTTPGHAGGCVMESPKC